MAALTIMMIALAVAYNPVGTQNIIFAVIVASVIKGLITLDMAYTVNFSQYGPNATRKSVQAVVEGVGLIGFAGVLSYGVREELHDVFFSYD